MYRFMLALRCFFLVLLYKRLPVDAAPLLPGAGPVIDTDATPAAPALAGETSAAPAAPPPPVAPALDEAKLAEGGALRLLALLQREGRLVDFVEEAIDGYSDQQVGAAVRDIHRGCKKALDEHLSLRPVLDQPDGAAVRVDAGFDPAAIKLVGDVVGQPPFHGTLRHPGWRAATVTLPGAADGHDPSVIAPAEVELGGA